MKNNIFLNPYEALRVTNSGQHIYGGMGDELVEIIDAYDIVIDSSVEIVKLPNFDEDNVLLNVKGNVLEAKDASSGKVIFQIALPDSLVIDVGGRMYQVNNDGFNGVLLNGSPIPVENAKSVNEILSSPIQDSVTYTGDIPSAEQLSYKNLSLDKIETDIAAPVFSGKKWDKPEVTFGFIHEKPKDYISAGGWSPIQESEQVKIEGVMKEVDNLLSLKINEEKDNPYSSADIRISAFDMYYEENGWENPYVEGYAYLPDEGGYGDDSGIAGDILLKRANLYSDFQDGKLGKYVFLHELGHALGLEHTFEGENVIDEQQDYDIYSVMSYNQFQNIKLDFTVENNQISLTENYLHMNTYGLLDYAALEKLYGLSRDYRKEDNVYKWVFNTKQADKDDANAITTQFDGGYMEFDGDNTIEFYGDENYDDRNDANTILIDTAHISIYDAGGEDTLDFSLTDSDNIINLASGTFSDINVKSIEEQKEWWKNETNHVNDKFIDIVFNYYDEDIYTGEKALSIAYGTIIENATGGSGKDVIWDNKVDNKLIGNAGDDIFYLGQGGFDTIDGGDGVDTIYIPDTDIYSLGYSPVDNSWIYVDPVHNFSFYADNVENIIMHDSGMNLVYDIGMMIA